MKPESGVTKAAATPRPASAGPCSSAAASVPSATSPEQDERGRGRQKTVQRVGGVDGREGNGGAGGGEDGGNVGDRQRFDRGDALLAARPFAGGQQRQREGAAEQGAHAGPEQSGVDRIADHEEAAERQRQSADPDHPAGADALLEPGTGLRKRRGRCWPHAGCGFRRGVLAFAIGAIDSAPAATWVSRPQSAGDAIGAVRSACRIGVRAVAAAGLACSPVASIASSRARSTAA